jgi:hypothetical protein
MRINGRWLRPSTLGERRIMLSLGLGIAFRVGRKENPFALARIISRMSSPRTAEVARLRDVAAQQGPRLPPRPPDSTSNDAEDRAA